MNEVEQQGRRLDALNEQEATRFLTELTTKLSAEKEGFVGLYTGFRELALSEGG